MCIFASITPPPPQQALSAHPRDGPLFPRLLLAPLLYTSLPSSSFTAQDRDPGLYVPFPELGCLR